jgi:hypothetical protein
MKLKWRKAHIDTHEGQIPCWWGVGDGVQYLVLLNVYHGRVGPNGGTGGWWYEIRAKVNNTETIVGEAPNVAIAKDVALDDYESRIQTRH